MGKLLGFLEKFIFKTIFLFFLYISEVVKSNYQQLPCIFCGEFVD